MEFRIADTFTDSLARLTGDEQKAAKLTAIDLQLNPAIPGLSFHKLDRARDKNFWSVRVGGDIRLIVHRSAGNLLLCYVDHHDKAYAWAERRKLETHPKTGAAQLVEIRETVREIFVPVYVQTPTSAEMTIGVPPIFADVSDDELLGYGVPPEWLEDVQNATEDRLLALTAHLPAEAAEALLDLATKPQFRQSSEMDAMHWFEERVLVRSDDAERYRNHDLVGHRPISPFDHPDAQRRFRIMKNVEELQRALDFPWEKWAVFLHPEQRQLVEQDYSGPARVSGSAGTGKTIVALHRAAFLARSYPNARVLLTTFSDTLAHALRTKLKRLLSNEPRLSERIDVYSINAIGQRLYRTHIGPATIASQGLIHELIRDAANSVGDHKFSQQFLFTEWDQVVDAWQLENWESYRDVARLGRKTRLQEAQRKILWSIFERVRAALRSRELITQSELFSKLASVISKTERPVFDFAVVDEAQDICIGHLRFFAALGGGHPNASVFPSDVSKRVFQQPFSWKVLSGSRSNALFFAGDLGQRTFQQPFSWKALGVDIRGRSRTLRVNYRTSHQIRMQADRLLAPVVTDADGNAEDRSNTVSVFNGPPPTIQSYENDWEEVEEVSKWIATHSATGIAPQEFAVFVRSSEQLERAQFAVGKAGLAFKILDEIVETTSGFVSIASMDIAKGLEFRAVVVMACDDGVIPSRDRIDAVGDDAELQEVYDTERQLLYVACTRARDHLLITGVDPVSEFFDDLNGATPQ